MQHEIWRPKTPLLDGNWRHTLAHAPCAVVLFGASWNSPDTLQDRELQAVRAEFEPQIAFFAVDLDDEAMRPLIDASDIHSNPTLLCFCAGEATHKLVGFHPALRLRDFLVQWIPR